MQDVKATDQTARRENAGRTKMQAKIAARENAICENAGRPACSHPAFSSLHIMATVATSVQWRHCTEGLFLHFINGAAAACTVTEVVAVVSSFVLHYGHLLSE